MSEQPACLQQPSPAPPALPAATLHCTVYGPDPAGHPAPAGFAALQSEWNALVRRARFNNFFSTYEWQTTWWQHLGSGDLYILAFRRTDTDALVGIAPLYLAPVEDGPDQGRPQFNLVGCVEVSDYLDVIAEQGWEEPVADAVHAWLLGPTAPYWELLDLCNLPEASLTWRIAPPRFAQSGCTVDVFQEDTAPQFILPRRFDDYLQDQVDKKQRHEIRRKQRRAEREAHIGLTLVTHRDNVEVEIEDFIALQRASRPDKADFMTPQMRRFFLAVAQMALEMNALRLFFLTINGEKAAAMFAFEYDRRFWLYNSGYDPDAHAQLSPGWVLLAYVIQYAIAAGCTVFDFMQGSEDYKYRFGAQDYKVMRVLVRRGT